MKKTIVLFATLLAIGCAKKETPKPKFDLTLKYSATWAEVYNWRVVFDIKNVDNYNFVIDKMPYKIIEKKGDTITLKSDFKSTVYVLFNNNYGVSLVGKDTTKIYNYSLD